jgi:hypothetical protein
MPFVLEEFNDCITMAQDKSQDLDSATHGLPSPTATHNSEACRTQDARRASIKSENNTESYLQFSDSTSESDSNYYDYDEEEEEVEE